MYGGAAPLWCKWWWWKGGGGSRVTSAALFWNDSERYSISLVFALRSASLKKFRDLFYIDYLMHSGYFLRIKTGYFYYRNSIGSLFIIDICLKK